jgi:hypothetical protein
VERYDGRQELTTFGAEGAPMTRAPSTRPGNAASSPLRMEASRSD